MRSNLFLAFLVLCLTGCSHYQLPKGHVQTRTFKIANYQKFTQEGQDLNVYIEGDGRVLIANRFISDDPSPKTTTVQKLASLDPAANVAYLARPCQYSPEDLKSVCKNDYWLTGRYSPIVIESINEAISILKDKSKAKKVNLIGFSGGGAIAVLIAARRDDVNSIRTVAANLDLQGMDQYHKSPPLTGSLDPMDVAKKVHNIKQVHFVGDKDKVVPSYIAKNFQKAANLRDSQIVILSGVSHHQGWVEQWPALLEYVP